MKVNLPILLVLLMLISVGISGCISSGDDDGNEGPAGVDIDEIGGWVSPDNVPVSLHFPENALSSSTKISIKKIDNLPEEEGLVEDLGFDFSPDGTVFNEPVKIRINYSNADLPEGIEGYMLRIYKIEENDNLSMIEDSSIDMTKKVIKGTIRSFSGYVVIGKKYGYEIKNTKKRIASDGIDVIDFHIYMRSLNPTDTTVPTGDPWANRHLKVEYGTKTTGVPAHYSSLKSEIVVTNKDGHAIFSVLSLIYPVPLYGMIRVTYVFGTEKTGPIKYYDIGFDWPYVNHFDEPLVGEEWSRYEILMDEGRRTYVGPNPISIESSPNGKERFLGPFTTDMIVLKLENIPPHYRVIIEFDFIAIGPWQEGAPDKTWTEILNDPDEVGYAYCHSFITLQEDDFTGGFDENDVINTLGYDTTPLVYEDGKGEEQTLERGDGIFPIDGYVQNHRKDSIEIGITVDERGFNEVYDEGQYWGIDNVYVRYVEYREV